MRIHSAHLRWVTLPLALVLVGECGASIARGAQARNRVADAVDDSVTVTLRGNVRPEVRGATAVGAPEQDLPMQHMILTLKPDQSQEAALAKLIQDQQNPHSSSYRKFLTPEQYGEQFGASSGDIAKVTGWLTDHGFSVEEVPAGRRSIVFSGNAGAVTSAFGTAIRKITSGGEVHYANTDEPRIPAAFSDVVGGLVKLNDFQHKTSIQRVQMLSRSAGVEPQFTSGGSHYLSPADYATIYDLSPLYASQINGTGESIAIVARSNISMSDLELFRSEFALPANNPTVIIASGRDPGFVEGDGDEATLDVQWSGAIAPAATVKLVVASSTASADGVDLSAQYIVNNNLAPVMSVSFGSCEAGMGSGGVGFYNALWQQAAAEGITVLISSGDSGAAGCYSGGSSSGSGRAVNGLCTSQYDVCVGGTEFAEGSNPGQYWLAGNNAALGSAQSYIPETVWNESGSNGGSGLWAGGGGASIYFSKPTWQSGVGVPADGARDVPDVALTAAGHDGYIIEESGSMYVIAGTSAASPSFAGMMALVNQKMRTRLGNPNAILYKLASLQTTGGARVFHDTTLGSNTVPGVTGFSASTGYDQASGLGSVDAAVLVNHWTDASGTSSPSLAAVNSSGTLSVTMGGTASFTTTVSGTGSFNSAVTISVSGAPAGVTVTLSSSSIASPGSGSVTVMAAASSAAAAGTYTLTVTAAGGNLVAKATTALTITSSSFKLVVPASGMSVADGASSAAPVSFVPSGAFNSQVTLTMSGLPEGVTASFSPAALSGTATATSTLTLSALPSTRTGVYSATLSGTGGGLTQTAALILTVINPSFALTSSASSVTVIVGGISTLAVSVAPSGGFNSTVSLAATGLPTGVTASFSPASLSGAANGSSVMTLTAGTTARGGTYTAVVTATGGGVVKTVPLIVTLPAPSFTLTAPAGSTTITVGSSAKLPVSLTPLQGFSSTVSLSVAGLPTGVTGSFSPATLSGAVSGTSTLTLAVGQNAAAGTHAMTVSATGGGVTRTATVTISVPAPTFTFSSSTVSATLLINGNASLPLLSVPSNGFNSTVSLSVPVLPTGVTASFSPASLSGSASASSTLTLAAGQTAIPGTYNVTVAAMGEGITRTVALAVTVPTPTFTLTSLKSSASLVTGGSVSVPLSIAPSSGFNSTVRLTASGLPTGVTSSFSPASVSGSAGGSSTLTLTAGQTAAAGSYVVTIAAAGAGLTKMTVLSLGVSAGAPSFTLTSSLSAISISPGGIAAAPVKITPGAGFTSTISLTVSGLPTGVTASFSPATFSGGTITTSALTFTAGTDSKAGSSVVTVTATGGGTTKTLVLNLTMTAPVTLSLLAFPSTLTVAQGSPGNCGSGITTNIANCVVLMTTVTGPITSVVSLAVSGLPTGVQASFDKPTVIATGNYLTFVASATAPLGTSTVTVTASGGGITKTLSIQLTVIAQPAFTLGLNNQFITVRAGGPAVPVTLSILTKAAGFNSPVALLAAGTISNITQNFSISTLTVATPSSTMSVSASASAQPGIYTLWIDGSAGTLTQTVGLSVTVTH